MNFMKIIMLTYFNYFPVNNPIIPWFSVFNKSILLLHNTSIFTRYISAESVFYRQRR
jgi:hypothetical protein